MEAFSGKNSGSVGVDSSFVGPAGASNKVANIEMEEIRGPSAAK